MLGQQRHRSGVDMEAFVGSRPGPDREIDPPRLANRFGEALVVGRGGRAVEHQVEEDPFGTCLRQGVGELGMVATPAAVRSAIIDALAPFGVTSIELPCTPERVWRAIGSNRST